SSSPAAFERKSATDIAWRIRAAKAPADNPLHRGARPEQSLTRVPPAHRDERPDGTADRFPFPPPVGILFCSGAPRRCHGSRSRRRAAPRSRARDRRSRTKTPVTKIVAPDDDAIVIRRDWQRAFAVIISLVQTR